MENEKVVVDKEDRQRVNEYKWSSQGRYLRVNRCWGGKQHNIYIHHFIVGQPVNRSLEVDHINRNVYDNRKKNLRFVTRQENNENKKEPSGVYWDKDRGNWVAQVGVGGCNRITIYLGSYKTRYVARRARLRWERSKTQKENKARKAARKAAKENKVK